jgi:hypothetical protein
MSSARVRALPQRSRVVGALRYLRMRMGQLLRGSKNPAPVGRPDYYKRELHAPLLVRSAQGLPVREFLDSSHREVSVRERAGECFERYGFYPLNFSFPRSQLMPESVTPRAHFLSSTIPGEPFSFDTWDEYLAEYRSAYWALSTKKGGWDTFRHLEILFSGSIPLMPGLARAHRYSLAHYPKRALVQVYQDLVKNGPAIPGPQTQAFFREFAHNSLTTQAMAGFLVQSAGLENSRVLFLDTRLPKRTDYLSIFTFIGLTQVLGSAVTAAVEPAYVYDDYDAETHRLYGRGFGYSKSLPASLRHSSGLSSRPSAHDVASLCESFDRVVVGNYDANHALVQQMLEMGVPAEKFVCIVGSDLPSDFRLRRGIRSSGMTFFVREFSGF